MLANVVQSKLLFPWCVYLIRWYSRYCCVSVIGRFLHPITSYYCFRSIDVCFPPLYTLFIFCLSYFLFIGRMKRLYTNEQPVYNRSDTTKKIVWLERDGKRFKLFCNDRRQRTQPQPYKTHTHTCPIAR